MNAAATTVSVIIPTYNRRTWVMEAIASVQAQTYRDFELIVVDDGSDDGTGDALGSERERINYLRLQHGGVSRARNAGLGVSCGKLVAFLDSDDLWLPQKLQRQIDCLNANPECRLCYTDEIWIRRGVRVNPARKHQKFSGLIFERCLPLCLISPSSALMRRELLEEMSGFDESLPICEDYDLWLRVTARYSVVFLPEKLIVKRGGHADQLSHSEWGIDRYRVQSLQKILAAGVLADAQRQAACQELLRKCRILEKGYVKHGRDCELHEIRELMRKFR